MKILDIDGIKIPLPLDKKLGILHSGGADSSLLLYILMSNYKDRLVIYTNAKDVNGRSSAVVSSRVIEKVIQLTGNSNIEHHVFYHSIQNIELLHQRPLQDMSENKIDHLYAAITANPPKEIADHFVTPEWNTEQNERDPTVIKAVIKTTFPYWIRPFTNIDKKKIAEIYNYLGITDTLFPYTFSCETKNKIENYDHCGVCWWCKEREWGFGRLT